MNRNLSSVIIVVVICAFFTILGVVGAVYGQDDPVYSSPGIEGLAESAQELECKIDAMESNETSIANGTSTMDRLKCEMGDLLKMLNVLPTAFAQDDDTEVTILEDDLAAEEMSDLGLDAEDEALLNEELGMEDLSELDTGSSGGDILPGDRDNFEEIPAGNENLPSAEQSGAGLNDACLQSGFSQEKCSNLLFSDDPGGYCSTLTFAGVACPQIQDPRFSYGNPDAALAESQEDIENTERAIEGFEQTVPDNLGEQFAQD
jgi:hypothetical protein